MRKQQTNKQTKTRFSIDDRNSYKYICCVIAVIPVHNIVQNNDVYRSAKAIVSAMHQLQQKQLVEMSA